MADYELTNIKGVSDSRADDLRDAGFANVDDIATASPDSLSEVKGIGSATADGLIESAQGLITEETLDDGDGSDTDTDDTDDADGEAEVEEPSQEELDDLVETDTDDDADMDDEVEAEDNAASDDIEGEDEGPPYRVEVTLESAEQYDYLYYALIDMRHGRFNMTSDQTGLADDLLAVLRPHAMRENEVVTLGVELEEKELNALHAALTQTQTDYHGTNDTGAFEAVQSVTGQVQATREEYIL